MSARSNAGRIGVWGRSGSGKSSYVKDKLRGTRRVVVFDPLGEYGAEGFRVVEHRRSGLDMVRMEMAANWSGFRIAYVPPGGREAAALSGLSRLLMAAQEPFRTTGRGAKMSLVVEEMNLSFKVNGGADKAAGFAEICSRGRHYGIEVIGISQRIAEVSTRFRGNCTETVVFPQKGARDLNAAAAELGVDVIEVRALQNLSYLHERGGTVTEGSVHHSATMAKGSVQLHANNENSAPQKKRKRA